jgi:hypothetical protein
MEPFVRAHSVEDFGRSPKMSIGSIDGDASPLARPGGSVWFHEHDRTPVARDADRHADRRR